MGSRSRNTRRNIEVSCLYTGLKILFQFVSRSVIIQILGKNYLGINSLYISIVQVLNMAELGFAGAISYSMYKPLADHDVETVCALLAYYRKIYRTIGTVILVCGLLVTPFLRVLFIKGDYPRDINLYVLFLLYLLNAVTSYYMFAYKTSLLEAAQRMDISKLIYTLVSFVQYSLQIIALVVFKNFYLFVFMMTLGTASINALSECLARKYFPEYQCDGELNDETKRSIAIRVRGLMICNVSSVTYTTLDSIIISNLMGLELVAKYNNYITIMTGVATIITLIRSAMQASVGNSIAKESVEKNYKDMLLWQFLFSGIVTFCVACMLCLYQPFMKLWMGADMLLPFRDVVIICVWFAVTSCQHAFFLYLSGRGLWWELRMPYLFSTISNLLLNLILGHYIGITGILLASLIASFVFGFIWQCSIIFSNYFHRSPSQYYLRQSLYFLVMIVASLVTYCITGLISIPNANAVSVFIVKLFAAAVLTFAVIFLAYFKTGVFKEATMFLHKTMKAK